MGETEQRQTEVLEEIRDLLREDVELRRAALDEQRRAAAKFRSGQRRAWLILLALFVFLLATAFVLPYLSSLFPSPAYPEAAVDVAVIPSPVDTARFDGTYDLIVERSFPASRERLEDEADPDRRRLERRNLDSMISQYRNFRVDHGVIRSGVGLVQELSLLHATVEGDVLRGEALWHEDIGDPGDMSGVPVVLRLTGDTLEFAMLDDAGEPVSDPVFLKRRRP